MSDAFRMRLNPRIFSATESKKQMKDGKNPHLATAVFRNGGYFVQKSKVHNLNTIC